MNLPDPIVLPWIMVRQPVSTPVLPLVTDLRSGETAVLALALESPDAVVILDDALARQVAATLDIPFHGSSADTARAHFVFASHLLLYYDVCSPFPRGVRPPRTQEGP
jgi:hypothetical protein